MAELFTDVRGVGSHRTLIHSQKDGVWQCMDCGAWTKLGMNMLARVACKPDDELDDDAPYLEVK